MRTLRRLIREYLDEMAYGGMIDGTVSATGGEVKKKIEKFHQTPLYMKKATSTFKNFPFDVWIQPVDTSDLDDFDNFLGVGTEDSHRINIMDLSDLTSQKGDLPIDIEKISAVVKGGGCVILSAVGGLTSGFLPTPWMIVHALFDSEDTGTGEHSEFSAIAFELEEYIETLFDEAHKIVPYMTMASARNKAMNGPNDITAELCTQEVVTTAGVNFKESKKPLRAEKLAKIKEKIKSYGLRDMVFNALRGKIIAIASS